MQSKYRSNGNFRGRLMFALLVANITFPWNLFLLQRFVILLIYFDRHLIIINDCILIFKSLNYKHRSCHSLTLWFIWMGIKDCRHLQNNLIDNDSTHVAIKPKGNFTCNSPIITFTFTNVTSAMNLQFRRYYVSRLKQRSSR